MFGFGAPRRETVGDALLAVDVETTGLTPGKHQLVSIGWVPVDGRVIDLSAARYFVFSGTAVGDSATIHGVTDDDISSHGTDARVILDEFSRALEGRRLLAHFAQMEVGFISHAMKQVAGRAWRLRDRDVVDTFAFERRHMERMGTYPRGEDLRLARVRQRYGLPDYRNHNALTDAIACAELYLTLTVR
ncbi:DNA polymerase III, epsilon subunit [Corynebacterium mycetoides]|uniref:DNA polymerase III, epsilon subunit n=1 Tax=Corynebacterium mycetoides TaxID=38302 RepID=A0A1G9M1V9_9CORY|nr:exonuclease domain-containing protein [Corynebacterium mycetoides]SDL68249.1 DNA polymerase III, epsilon subunit [Corynebacterium mycetoides]